MLLKKGTILFFLFFAILFLAMFPIKMKDEMIDFEVNYKAGMRLRSGETLYQTADGHFMFKYLPSSAFLYLPLSLLPLSVAKFIWYFLITACSFALIYVSNRLLPENTGIPVYMIVLPFLILAKFFLREIHLGQINTVLTLILLAMIWCMVSEKKTTPFRREIYTGLLWGLAIALKPYAMIFLPYFLVKKMWKSLLSGLGFLCLALLAPSLFYGFRGNLTVLKEWASTLSQSTPGQLITHDNISILAFFMKCTGKENLSLLLAVAVVAGLAILVWITVLKGREMARSPVLECAILLVLIPLVSPLGWDYTLLMSMPGVVMILHYFPFYSKGWKAVLVVNLCIITFSIYDLMGRTLYKQFMAWSVLTVNFLILAGYLVYLRYRKIC